MLHANVQWSYIINILFVEMKHDLMSRQTSWAHLLEPTAMTLAINRAHIHSFLARLAMKRQCQAHGTAHQFGDGTNTNQTTEQLQQSTESSLHI